MVKVEKYETEKGYTFKIVTEDGMFTISFEGVLDLFWNYLSPDIFNETKKTFEISKEDEQFYELIENLYNNIKSNEKLEIYNSNKLFQNDKILWHSDDYTYEDSAILEIKKNGESYNITFYKGKTDVRKHTFSIRICNSGSRYKPFNQFFMEMYRELKNYEDNYHQVTMNEYLNEIKRTRKK